MIRGLLSGCRNPLDETAAGFVKLEANAVLVAGIHNDEPC
jgi:hypothetical protein